MPLSLTIHRGTHEVGGTCIEIAAGQSRLVLDIGMPLFGPDRDALDSWELRRKSKSQLAEAGIIPKVPGLFDDNEIPPNAIILSHAHLDHTGLLDHTRPEVPVYASRGTSKMMLAGRLFAGQVELPRERFRELPPDQPVEIGSFRVTGFPVDHSIFGCMAILIEAEGKTVVYTGDIRLHGRKPGMARSLLDSLHGRNIDVLLMEGTHFGLPTKNDVTEYELEDQIVTHVNDAAGLVLASFSPQHVDRLVAFIRAAKKTKRTFVADVYTAFILHLIASETKVPQPVEEEGIRVYFPKSFLDTFKRRGMANLHDRFSASQVTMDEIIQNAPKQLMVFRPSMLKGDFRNSVPTDTVCLYSRWEGYLEKPEWTEAATILEDSNGQLIPVHTTGHILANDISSFVQSIRPATVIPVHTFEPDQFRHHITNVRVLNDGEPHTVD